MEAKFEQLNIKDDITIENKPIDTIAITAAITDIKINEPSLITTTSTIPKTKKRITPKLISTSIDSTTTSSTTPNPFNFNYDLSAPISSMFSAFFSQPTNQIVTTTPTPTTITTTTPPIIPTETTTTTITNNTLIEKKTKKRIEKDKEIKIKEKRKRKERIRKKPSSSSVTIDDTDDKPTTNGTSNTYYDDADDDADQDETIDSKKKSTILPPQPTTKRSTSPSLKKKKKVKVSKTLNILEPFSFLISMAPNVHALFYLDLKDWIFSDDLNIELLPFTSNNTDKLESNGIDIKELIKIINNNELLELNKSKLVIISDIYNINLKNSSSTLLIDNNKFLKAQKELWWVKTTNKWFMKPSVMKQSSHFKIWFGFLVLELWYRFIWAYHTQSVYNTLIGDNKLVGCSSGDTSVLDELQMEIDHSSTNSSHGNHHDEVIDLDDLGKGDEEDDEDDEEEDDDDDGDEIIIYEGEDNTNPINNKSSLKDSNNGSGKKDTSCSDQHSSTSSDDSMDVDDVDEDDEEKEINNNNEDEESSQATTTTSNNNNTAQLELIPTMVPIFFVHDTITESINEIEAEYWDTGVWNIRKAIDTFSQFIHSYYRDSKSLPSLTFAEIHENIHKFYNKKYKAFINDQCITIDGQDGYNWSWSNINESVTTTTTATSTPTTTTTTTSANETTKPLLLLSTPPQPTPSSPPPKNRLLEFVNEINVQQFSNLTQNGVVSHSHNFYYLFPFFTDMKPPTHPISDYYMGLKRRLEKQGVYNKEVEKIVETLDRLLEERALINRSSIQSENSSSGTTTGSNGVTSNNSSVPSVLKAVDDYQNTRIKYLDELIVTLKAEYHKLTNKVDQLPSTKKTSKLRPPTTQTTSTPVQSTTTLALENE